MTQTESALLDVADALNRLALTVLALICVLIIMSWTLDDMAMKIHLFGFMVRRLTRPQPADTAVPPVTEPTTPAAPDGAAKEVRHEGHSVRP